MRLFSSDEEYPRCSGDCASMAVTFFIVNLLKELEKVKAESDAASTAAEQARSLTEQKYLAMSSEFSELQSKCSQLQSSLDQSLGELSDVQAQKHHLHLQCIEKDGEIEKLTSDLSESIESRRQLMELMEQKDLELAEKNAAIKSYLDEIESLTNSDSQKEVPLSDLEAELARTQATCSRLSQEKELVEADMSSKLAVVEKQLGETSDSLEWNKERVEELETRLKSLQEESLLSENFAAAKEKLFSDMHAHLKSENASSEESSRRVKELEDIVRALATHLGEVEDDNKDRLDKEVYARRQKEKEAEFLKVKLRKCVAEMKSLRNDNVLKLLLPSSSSSTEKSTISSDLNERGVAEISNTLKWSIERVEEMATATSVQLGNPFRGFSYRIDFPYGIDEKELIEFKVMFRLELDKHTVESAPTLVMKLRKATDQIEMIESRLAALRISKEQIQMKKKSDHC